PWRGLTERHSSNDVPAGHQPQPRHGVGDPLYVGIGLLGGAAAGGCSHRAAGSLNRASIDSPLSSICTLTLMCYEHMNAYVTYVQEAPYRPPATLRMTSMDNSTPQNTLAAMDPSKSRRRPAIFAFLMAGLFMGALDNQIVATALPTIVREFGHLERF